MTTTWTRASHLSSKVNGSNRGTCSRNRSNINIPPIIDSHRSGNMGLSCQQDKLGIASPSMCANLSALGDPEELRSPDHYSVWKYDLIFCPWQTALCGETNRTSLNYSGICLRRAGYCDASLRSESVARFAHLCIEHGCE